MPILTMFISCCAVGCTNQQQWGSSISFYRFPADIDRRNKWISAVKRANWTPSNYSRICSAHFIRGEFFIVICANSDTYMAKLCSK